MTYTTTNLVTDAYKLSSIVSRELETVSGSELSEGIQAANEVIGDKTADKSMIPYFMPTNFDTIVGQEMYFIPNMIEATTIVFFLDTVRYAMEQVSRDIYFGFPRAENIQSLPFTYHVERCYGGANVFVYFLPNQIYNMQAWGKFSLSSIVLGQNLALTIDQFYINYLKYATGERLCHNYHMPVPQNITDQLEYYEDIISKRSGPLDLTLKKLSTLQGNSFTLSYAQVNLGKGWGVS